MRPRATPFWRRSRPAPAAASQAASGGAADEAPAGQTAEPPNLARDLADATLAAAGEALAALRQAGAELQRIGRLTALTGEALDSHRAEILPLLATILCTIAVALLMKAAAGRLNRHLLPPGDAGTLLRIWRAGLALLVRLGGLALAWGGGWLLAAAFAPDGWPSQAQALYLNAFAVFGLLRLLLRAFANPEAGREPAFSLLDPHTQAALFRPLRAVAGVVVQGFLFVVPLVQLWGGFALARPARTLVATLAALTALWAIRAMLRALDRAASPTGASDAAPGTATGSVLPSMPPRALAADGADPASPLPAESSAPMLARGLGTAWRRIWPPLAVLYVLYAWWVAVTRPAMMEEIVLGGTALTAVALAVLLGALSLLRRVPTLQAPLPDHIARQMPTLPGRMTRILRAIVAVGAVGALIGALLLAAGLGLARHRSAAGPGWLQTALWRLVSALLVLLLSAIVWAIVASWIDARLSADPEGRPARTRTLLALFRNAFGIAVAVIAVMVSLSQMGIDIAPLLAGAGVVGLAVGFGSQKLVQDIINGIFIQLENAMDVGDVVGVAGITGAVERLTIRSVRLRTLDGATHVIPFSAVDTVTNLTRDFGYHVAEITVGYDESVEAVKEAMTEAFARLRADPVMDRDIDGPLDLQGVVELRETGMVLRARIRTRAGRHWEIGRRYSELLKTEMDARGIEIAATTRTVFVPPRRGMDGASLPLPGGEERP
ncbi:Small-conductance mechanosensitive channel [Rubellimicrobium thermophilum DSM 16684]|uniref:Small-conductance mechanosensitive channel n=1 Tax=Rubellimicrobium thermophilum DSM 16684 TaxID=1123069 RepID=S9RYP6_9RHOB|nr:mechanosensitive ion channel domain-containing protein [Rubellimicrobium thermophilum]EPX83110.1 Small-conductance mechanosensitive channel [Rubellimicrobium thermophilum DSM 16684]